MDGLAAAKRGQCDIAPVHLMDSETGEYNRPFLTPELDLVPGYRRLQGFVFRPDDLLLSACAAAMDAIAVAVENPEYLPDQS